MKILSSIIALLFTVLILLISLVLFDLTSYDSSYINKKSLTFSTNNLNSKKTKIFFLYYDNLYHRIASKLFEGHRKYWKPELASKREKLPKRII